MDGDSGLDSAADSYDIDSKMEEVKKVIEREISEKMEDI